MAHVLLYQEWQSQTGNWYCNDVKDLGGISGLWWIPARMMDMSLTDYISWLIKNYKPDNISWNGKILIFSWAKEHYGLCHKFVLDINRIARNKHFIC